jgi:membrane fusion protein, multidrug efflux system
MKPRETRARRQRTSLTHAIGAAPNARRWLVVCSLGCTLILLAGCPGSGDPDKPKKAHTETPKAPSSDTVELKTDVQGMLHLKIEGLSAASAPQELTGYGRVLDPTSLVAVASEWAVAKASAMASGQELERAKILQKQSTASVRALQAAESTAARDRLLVESIRDRIALTWGRVIARHADLTGLLRDLTAQDRVIVRVEVPVGEGPAAQPQRARLAALGDPQKTIEAEFLGPAPVTDPQLQGQGFLFLTHHNALNLTPGTAVTAYLELGGEAHSGVFAPASALLRYDSRTWVYTQISATSFLRTPVSLGPSMPNGWLISQGVHAGDRVVTQGAQVLLSEELKPQIRVPD